VPEVRQKKKNDSQPNKRLEVANYEVFQWESRFWRVVFSGHARMTFSYSEPPTGFSLVLNQRPYTYSQQLVQIIAAMSEKNRKKDMNNPIREVNRYYPCLLFCKENKIAALTIFRGLLWFKSLFLV
jgi:hypothetical protein